MELVIQLLRGKGLSILVSGHLVGDVVRLKGVMRQIVVLLV